MSNVIFVCYHDDGVALVMQVLEELHDIVGSFGIKVTGGLIGQYDGRIINQCEVDIEENDNVESLAKKVLEREHTFWVETLELIIQGKIQI